MCVIKHIQDYACSPQLCRINEKQIWSLHAQPWAADWFFLSGHWLYMRRIKWLNPSSLLHSSFLFPSLTLKPEDVPPLKSSFGPWLRSLISPQKFINLWGSTKKGDMFDFGKQYHAHPAHRWGDWRPVAPTSGQDWYTHINSPHYSDLLF